MALDDTTVRVVVTVLTYQRVAQLRALLPQLIGQVDELQRTVRASARIVVVDNDAAHSAAVVAEGAGELVAYVHEEAPGIAAGRARAVLEAGDADLLVFIDDDEVPVGSWLATLVGTWLLRGRPAGVVGRVSPTYYGMFDPWIEAGGFFRRPIRATGDLVTAASSANLALDLALLRRLGLSFDTSLGLRGGEDTMLTQTLTRSGHQLVWCNEAEVIDVIPPERMNRSWVLRRAFSHGAVASRIEITFARSATRARVRLVAVGVSRVVAGLAAAGLGSLTGRVRTRARGWRLVYRGAGLVSGALGRDAVEYRRAATA